MPAASPPRPLILFAPGAGAPSSSAWMRAWATRLSRFGRVVRFDYPYQRAGRRSPDRRETLISAHLEALERARKRHRGPVVLAGKSMGSRIGCHLSLEVTVEALICFGYPLRSPTGALRDEVLRAVQTPVFFVQGTRDPLCPLDLFDAVRAQMTAPVAVHVVDGGDHSLCVGARHLKARALTQTLIDDAIASDIGAFLARALTPGGPRDEGDQGPQRRRSGSAAPGGAARSGARSR